MKIRALSNDTGGCHFYRIRTPLTALRSRGHEATWGTGITAEELRTYDVLVAQFLNGERDLAGWEAIAAAPRSVRPALVIEADDDLFTIDQVITSEVTRKKVLWADPAVQERVKRFMALADLVTVSTPHLARLYAPFCRKVVVLPNSIPDWLLDVAHPGFPSSFTAGWTCSHSHLLDARYAVPLMERFFHDHSDARFVWMGPPRVDGGFPDSQQTCRKWNRSVESYLTGTFGVIHVGIAALGDYQFNYGKSGIKADEYAAWGCPVLASDFPQYREAVIHGETGFLIKGQTEWRRRLEMLYQDRSLLSVMGKAAKENVAGRTIGHRVHLWEEAYQEVADER